VIVRCTLKALKLLAVRPASLPDLEPGPDDWYLNLLWFDRRKCLLLMHADTMFSVFIPDVRKADLDPPGPLLTAAVRQALDDEGLPRGVLGPLDPKDVTLARTASRRVLGYLNQNALRIEYALDRPGGLAGLDVADLNRELQRTLHGQGVECAKPLDLVRARLAA
jgi:hypothetical protein